MVITDQWIMVTSSQAAPVRLVPTYQAPGTVRILSITLGDVDHAGTGLTWGYVTDGGTRPPNQPDGGCGPARTTATPAADLDGPLLSVKLLPPTPQAAYCMRDMARVTRVIRACLVAARLRASV
jgi:hypothetical protein